MEHRAQKGQQRAAQQVASKACDNYKAYQHAQHFHAQVGYAAEGRDDIPKQKHERRSQDHNKTIEAPLFLDYSGRHTAFLLSYLVISILGAIGHNMGQLFGAAMLTGTALTLYYFPILILSGIGMGFVTGLVLKTVLPALEKLDRRLG